MKNLLLFVFIVFGGFAAYVAFDISRSVSEVRESISGEPGTLGYEIRAGLVEFYQIAHRFPESKAELIAGLAKLKVTPSKLLDLQTMTFSRKHQDTIVKYVRFDGTKGELVMSGPFTEDSTRK
jgi:hypothetical protein